jgi:glycosyltransferase involved in cell wall biosynthesis
MLVSIVIPLFNQEEFVAETIESAWNQTHKEREIVIVNDGSTDSSLSIASRYPVRIINQSNRGLAAARNTGIMNSKGDFILPLDSDDKIDSRYIEKTLPLMERSVGIVSSNMQCFGIDNSLISIGNISLEEEMTANKIPVCSLVRKEALLEIGGYNPRMARGYEDWLAWIEILKRGWTHRVINESLFFYRRKAQSMITDAGAHHLELFGDIKKLNKDIF